MTEPQEPERQSQSAPDPTGGVSRVSEAEAGLSVTEIHEPQEQPLRRRREDIRGALALTFAGFFGGTLAAGFVAAMIGGEAWTNGRDFLEVALPAITGLLGSAVGFYFGTQK